ncbi:hypothetical protein TRIUR3_00628 [Triticum urartu]|uniref:Wall-associated receptor kinase galacturonan-binding domain-containing protein n=1 Tax=Triticum urartu TaxID=4572 RepID=M7YQA3_TRIUA|nr:hypothetical protein TRIUR3_00628 [Triticum urartu]
MALGRWFFWALWLPLILVVTAAREQREGCSDSAKRCGNMSISGPFWLRDNVAEQACGSSDFEVICFNNTTPVLRSSIPGGYGFAIIRISYEQRSLRVADVGKLELLSDGCLEIWNTSAELGVPFRIAPDNLNLILYSCTEATSAAAMARRDGELAQTRMRCGDESRVFVRAAGRYDGTGGYGGYAVQGCAAAAVPVRGRGSSSGEANASDYERVIKGGFLMTWDPPPLPPPTRPLCIWLMCTGKRVDYGAGLVVATSDGRFVPSTILYPFGAKRNILLSSSIGRNHPPPSRMVLPWLGPCLLLLLAVVVSPMLAAAADAGGCAPGKCGNLAVSIPFGVVHGSEENRCAHFGFQVHCKDDVPYLGYYEPEYGLQILDIFYSNGSLLVSDVHKLGDFDLSRDGSSFKTFVRTKGL